jgi:hypothetical protein
MGRTLRIQGARALHEMDIPTKYLVLTIAVALRDGASGLRFERRPGIWAVSEWTGGEWQERVPMKAEAEVDRAVQSLARPPGLRGLWAAVFGGDGSGEFALRFAFGAEVRCAVGEFRLGESVTLLMHCEGDGADQAEELFDEYRRLFVTP